MIIDALSLVAVQPEGVVASEAARTQLRSTVKRAAQATGREAIESATTDAAKAVARRGAVEGLDAATESARLARWWAVRAAGGTYRVLQRLPEALPRLTVPEIADLGRGLCAKAGLSLTTWGPLRFLKEGEEIVRRIPPSRGLKYLGVQATQATVGVVGFRKLVQIRERSPVDLRRRGRRRATSPPT